MSTWASTDAQETRGCIVLMSAIMSAKDVCTLCQIRDDVYSCRLKPQECSGAKQTLHQRNKSFFTHVVVGKLWSAQNSRHILAISPATSHNMSTATPSPVCPSYHQFTASSLLTKTTAYHHHAPQADRKWCLCRLFDQGICFSDVWQACASALGSSEFYEHSKTEQWNTTIIVCPPHSNTWSWQLGWHL